MQSLAETPWASEMEDELQKVIVWATLKNKYFKLVGSDLAGDASIVTGNNVSILVQCRSLSERQELIKKLKNKAIQPAIDADPLVNIVDMYRVNWILSIQ